MDDKMTTPNTPDLSAATITAADWHLVAQAVKDGKAVVTWQTVNMSIVDIRRDSPILSDWMWDYRIIYKNGVMFGINENEAIFNVRWLDTPHPQHPAESPAANSEETTELTQLRAQLATVEAQNKALRKALEPFAKAYENAIELDDDDDLIDEHIMCRYQVGNITAGDLIRAKIALTQQGSGSEES